MFVRLPHSGEEMATTETDADKGEKNFPCSSAVKNLSLRGGWPPAEPGGRIGAKLWRRQWTRLHGLPAPRQGPGAHENRQHKRGGELPAQRRGKEARPERGVGATH